MTCHNCKSICKKFGKYGAKKIQRYRCKQCGRTYSDEQEKPLEEMRVSLDKALNCLQLLLEGMSIRSTQRVTGLHPETILNLLVLAGERCERLLDERMRGLKVRDVQADEMWGFVQCKEKTKLRLGKEGEAEGNAWCFVALERHTKVVLAWHLCHKRSVNETVAFTEKIYNATEGRFQLSTDGLTAYPDAVAYSLGTRVDYAQLIKIFAHPRDEQGRYSPPEVVEIISKKMWGNPDEERICTSHVERQNLTMRMQIRRLTRLTNAFSKKWANLRAALALYFAYYNFCRVHKTLRCTPAMEQGLTNHIWTLGELITATR